jgi:tRNA nucleotidyltransferase (CCA-adding enzyme)
VTPRWEHFPHGADIGVRGVGGTLDEAFAQVALAVTGVVTDPAHVRARDVVAITCAGDNAPDLLFAWIDALVFEMSTRHMLFARFDVRIAGAQLSALAWGEPVDRARHEPAIEVKGPTFTQLSVSQHATTGEWIAQCVVDV